MESALSCFGCMPPSRSKVDGAAAIKVRMCTAHIHMHHGFFCELRPVDAAQLSVTRGQVPDLRRGVPPPGKQARLRTRSSTNGMPRALSPANNEPSAQPPLDFNIFESIGSSMQSMTPSSAPGLDSWASSFGPVLALLPATYCRFCSSCPAAESRAMLLCAVRSVHKSCFALSLCACCVRAKQTRTAFWRRRGSRIGRGGG